MELKKEKEFLFGLMGILMKEISKIIKCMDLVLLNGKINNIKVNGKIVE